MYDSPSSRSTCAKFQALLTICWEALDMSVVGYVSILFHNQASGSSRRTASAGPSFNNASARRTPAFSLDRSLASMPSIEEGYCDFLCVLCVLRV